MATISELLQKYADGKDKLAELKRQFDVEEKEIKEGMAKIASALKEYADKEGLEKLTSSDWSLSWQQSDYPRIASSEDFYAYIIETNQLDLLEKRPAKLAVMGLIKAGEIVPGIEVFSEMKPSFRKVG